MSRRETRNGPRADRKPNEAQRRQADRGSHSPYLPVLALVQRDFEPGGRDRATDADGRLARPQSGRVGHPAHDRRSGGTIGEVDAPPERFQRRVGRLAFDFNPIRLRQLEARPADPCLERTVRGEDDQALAVGRPDTRSAPK